MVARLGCADREGQGRRARAVARRRPGSRRGGARCARPDRGDSRRCERRVVPRRRDAALTALSAFDAGVRRAASRAASRTWPRCDAASTSGSGRRRVGPHRRRPASDRWPRGRRHRGVEGAAARRRPRLPRCRRGVRSAGGGVERDRDLGRASRRAWRSPPRCPTCRTRAGSAPCRCSSGDVCSASADPGRRHPAGPRRRPGTRPGRRATPRTPSRPRGGERRTRGGPGGPRCRLRTRAGAFAIVLVDELARRRSPPRRDCTRVPLDAHRAGLARRPHGSQVHVRIDERSAALPRPGYREGEHADRARAVHVGHGGLLLPRRRHRGRPVPGAAAGAHRGPAAASCTASAPTRRSTRSGCTATRCGGPRTSRHRSRCPAASQPGGPGSHRRRHAVSAWVARARAAPARCT